jgi:hypothetical protein
MEPITGVERISKQRWKLVSLDSWIFNWLLSLSGARNVPFAILGAGHAFNAARTHVSLRTTSLARARRNS